MMPPSLAQIVLSSNPVTGKRLGFPNRDFRAGSTNKRAATLSAGGVALLGHCLVYYSSS